MAPQQITPSQSPPPRVSFTVSRALLAKPTPTSAADDEICLYPSKKCTNRRAKKKNGELHTMCEYHRIRANENQRRLERRRKAALRFPQRHAPKPTLWNREFPDPLPLPLSPMALPLPEPKALQEPSKRHDVLTNWQPIEIEILLACLFDTADDRMPAAAPCWPPVLVMAPTPLHAISLPQFV